jgi:DNA-binding NarL/FixJ family response regulator
MSIRVFIVDQHEIVRAGIASACSHQSNLEIVGQSSSIQVALPSLVKSSVDVLVVDPDCDPAGLAAVARLHQSFPQVKILVFTANDGPDYAAKILATGALGYLTKLAGVDEISVAIRLVDMGRIFISHSRPDATRLNIPSKDDPSVVRLVDQGSTLSKPHLSGREQEVLNLLADGMTNKQAAEKLYLSVKTVETYRARIMKKHGLKNRVELTRFARSTVNELAQQ